MNGWFQSAPRVRGETFQSMKRKHAGTVSIRAPRAGRNSFPRETVRSRLRFQSAPRVRGETPAQILRCVDDKVSIRAPRAGRNMTMNDTTQAIYGFNPRPACGAKHENRILPADFTGFNPRPACGAKRSAKLRRVERSLFQSAPRVRGETTTRRSEYPPLRRFNPRPACGAKPSHRNSLTAFDKRRSFREPAPQPSICFCRCFRDAHKPFPQMHLRTSRSHQQTTGRSTFAIPHVRHLPTSHHAIPRSTATPTTATSAYHRLVKVHRRLHSHMFYPMPPFITHRIKPQTVLLYVDLVDQLLT